MPPGKLRERASKLRLLKTLLGRNDCVKISTSAVLAVDSIQEARLQHHSRDSMSRSLSPMTGSNWDRDTGSFLIFTPWDEWKSGRRPADATLASPYYTPLPHYQFCY